MNNSEKGFSLLEVLVAFVVLSVSLGIILQIFSLSFRTTRSAAMYQQALVLAQSKIEQEIAKASLSEGGSRGELDDRFQWTTAVRSFQFPDQELVVNDAIQPYLIEVTISWNENPEQSLTLSTVRLERNR